MIVFKSRGWNGRRNVCNGKPQTLYVGKLKAKPTETRFSRLCFTDAYGRIKSTVRILDGLQFYQYSMESHGPFRMPNMILRTNRVDLESACKWDTLMS